MKCIVLAPTERIGQTWQYAVENLGADWRCSPVISAEQALLLLTDWVDAVLLLPCRESDALLHLLADTPLLAPPFLLGAGMDAPDGPIRTAAELPALLTAGTLPAMAACHLNAAADMAAALFRTMQMPLRLRAWAFLPDMAALTVVHPPLLCDLRHGLYPLTGTRHGLSAAGVERSLRLCVESTWVHGSLEALERFFGHSVDPERGKPTNREFLCRVQERLTLTMRRLV